MESCVNQQATVEAAVCKIERQVGAVEKLLVDLHNVLFVQAYPDLKPEDERHKVLEMRLDALSGRLEDVLKELGGIVDTVQGQLGSLRLVG